MQGSRHLRTAQTHERAAETHERAASYWAISDPRRSKREQNLAAVERRNAAIDRYLDSVSRGRPVPPPP